MTDEQAEVEILQSPPFPPISRLTLALYCGASGDDNPLHVDTDAAKAAGYDDVIAHGMLPMAYLGRFLTEHFPQEALQQLHVRFTAMTRVGDRLVCRAVPVADATGSGTTTYTVQVTDQFDEVKLSGHVDIAKSK